MQGLHFGSPIIDLGNIHIKGKPFQAQFEHVVSTKLANGSYQKRITAGTILRDSNGRLRQEVFSSGTPDQAFSIIYILEPINKVSLTLDSRGKTVTQDEYFPTAEEESGEKNGQSNSAPTRDVEGIKCKIYQLQLQGGIEVEILFSDDLQMVLLQKTQTHSEEKVLRVYNITRAEPDNNFFIVPPNYKRLQ